jgi:hypothetical protein
MVSLKYCNKHYGEMQLLYNTSDNFNTVSIKNTNMCIINDCTENTNLVAGKWCLYHYYQFECQKLNSVADLVKCDYPSCKKKGYYDINNRGAWCRRHSNPSVRNKVTCNVYDCLKTANLIDYDGKKWCKGHYKIYINPSILTNSTNNASTEKIQNGRFTYTKSHKMCNVDDCLKTSRLIEHEGKKWCKKHYELHTGEKYHVRLTSSFNLYKLKKDDAVKNNSSNSNSSNSNSSNSNSSNSNSSNSNSSNSNSNSSTNLKDDNNIIDTVIVKKYVDIVKNNLKIIDKKDKKDKTDKKCKIDKDKKCKINKDKNIIMDNETIVNIINQCTTKQVCSSILFSKKGKEICHANECKMYKRLYNKYKGKWCDEHYEEMTQIRTIINKHEGNTDEMIARFRELKLRRYTDINHLEWAIKMFKNINDKYNK